MDQITLAVVQRAVAREKTAMERIISVALVTVLCSCATASAPSSSTRNPAEGILDGEHMITIDIERNPNLQFRIDNFSVPEGSRDEFEAAMRRNRAFIKTLPGFLGHVVFEKTGGPTPFNVATIAIWESKEAVDRAGEEVRAYYKKIGFDMPAMLARWGIKAEVGNFTAPRKMQ